MVTTIILLYGMMSFTGFKKDSKSQKMPKIPYFAIIWTIFTTGAIFLDGIVKTYTDHRFLYQILKKVTWFHWTTMVFFYYVNPTPVMGV